MTRINLVPVEELSDQHLFAEYRELPRMAQYALKAKNPVISKTFTLNCGHMKFFLNKSSWLEDRHQRLTAECKRRGINIAYREPFQMPKLFGDVNYVPTESEISLSRSRIEEKLKMRPEFYRWSNR